MKWLKRNQESVRNIDSIRKEEEEVKIKRRLYSTRDEMLQRLEKLDNLQYETLDNKISNSDADDLKVIYSELKDVFYLLKEAPEYFRNTIIEKPEIYEKAENLYENFFDTLKDNFNELYDQVTQKKLSYWQKIAKKKPVKSFEDLKDKSDQLDSLQSIYSDFEENNFSPMEDYQKKRTMMKEIDNSLFQFIKQYREFGWDDKSHQRLRNNLKSIKRLIKKSKKNDYFSATKQLESIREELKMFLSNYRLILNLKKRLEERAIKTAKYISESELLFNMTSKEQDIEKYNKFMLFSKSAENNEYYYNNFHLKESSDKNFELNKSLIAKLEQRKNNVMFEVDKEFAELRNVKLSNTDIKEDKAVIEDRLEYVKNICDRYHILGEKGRIKEVKEVEKKFCKKLEEIAETEVFSQELERNITEINKLVPLIDNLLDEKRNVEINKDVEYFGKVFQEYSRINIENVNSYLQPLFVKYKSLIDTVKSKLDMLRKNMVITKSIDKKISARFPEKKENVQDIINKKFDDTVKDRAKPDNISKDIAAQLKNKLESRKISVRDIESSAKNNKIKSALFKKFGGDEKNS